MKKRYIRMIIVIILLTLIDQVVKQLVVNEVIANSNINYIQNYGGALGIGEDSNLLFILINVVILFIIIKFVYSQKDRLDNKTLISFTMILGGGFGNLIDRVIRGYVVDFIDISNLFKFPIFNIADVFVVMGWIMLFISIIIFWYKEVTIVNK